MSIYKRKNNMQQETEIDENTDYIAQYETEIEETETEEEEQSQESEQTESIPTSATRPTAIAHFKPTVPTPLTKRQPVASASKDKASDTRVYLTTKVDRELHSRLKVYSYKAHKSIARVLEELIAQHIPEI